MLIPNDEIDSAVGLRDFNVQYGDGTGIYDLDEIAADFHQTKRETSIYTMIMLKTQNSRQISFITSRECRVCRISLQEFSLFSDLYSEKLKHFGILACSFTESKIRFLIDVRKIMDYKNSLGDFLEEI